MIKHNQDSFAFVGGAPLVDRKEERSADRAATNKTKQKKNKNKTANANVNKMRSDFLLYSFFFLSLSCAFRMDEGLIAIRLEVLGKKKRAV